MKKKKTRKTKNSNKAKNRISYFARECGKEIASAAVGTGATFGAISGAGIGGFSAAGITSGLAALGAGSMLGGVLVAPALGYGAYRTTKWIFSKSGEFN
jgi:hypothetical protein